ncbi:MAG: RNA polymerase sigma factor [Candidatus Izemoplasmatales bacterium]|jgi:RNA polymerase sigma-70 factor (ECF subfamily)|nr:RNA polymerase sigma factor [Candidatus Izemoplasmatales bacterium]
MGESLNQLVRELKAGNMAVFDQIYQDTYRKVYFIVIGILHDHQLSEDIIQDTYMKMLDNIHSYKEKNFLAYLLTIAKNLSFNEYNRRKKITYTDQDIDTFSEVDLEEFLDVSVEKQEFIHKALSCLDFLEKNVFLLHTIENMSHKEISLLLNKPLGTITWIYQKALKKIRLGLKEDYNEIKGI